MKTDVRLDSAGLKLAGHLFTSDDGAPGPRPAVVIGHPGSGVKEQASGLYAGRLSEAGFIALAFDAAYQGESEGEPRALEDPAHHVEGIKAAVSFLRTQGVVDPDWIGALGICASGGYVISAAATDHRIKAVATVSGVDLGRHFRNGGDGTQDEAVIQSMLDAAAAARTAEARCEEVGVFPLFPKTEEEARVQGRYTLEGYEHYVTSITRHPRSAKTLTWSSVGRIVSFDAFRFIHMISPRPLLFIVGREAATSWMAKEAFIAARAPKQWQWIEGASHNDLYHVDEDGSGALAPDFAHSVRLHAGSQAIETATRGERAQSFPTEA